MDIGCSVFLFFGLDVPEQESNSPLIIFVFFLKKKPYHTRLIAIFSLLLLIIICSLIK